MATAVIVGCSGGHSPSSVARSDKAPVTVAMTAGDLTAKADVPAYPGASFPEGKSSLGTAAGQTRVEIVMETPDSVATVAAYYKRSLSHSEIIGSGQSLSVLGMTPHLGYGRVAIERHGNQTEIHAVTRIDSNGP